MEDITPSVIAYGDATFPKGTAELPQSKPGGFDSSLGEGAFGMAGKFPAEPQSLRVAAPPWGSCRA